MITYERWMSNELMIANTEQTRRIGFVMMTLNGSQQNPILPVNYLYTRNDNKQVLSRRAAGNEYTHTDLDTRHNSNSLHASHIKNQSNWREER
ncbi:hypothetical protein J2T41_004493 [Pseudomonas citronellolis]|nr:hypothetical protein [Pseudomonas citronellolis]MCP1699105.1 hypothetical protein [Pseudomonas citronellolis]MCP1704906.1 hypothetical protein [Pseudomonas citronellolis]